MGCFYNKEILIYAYGETADKYGITRRGYTEVITTDSILVDIQPYSSQKAKEDYGYEIETTKRIFMDIMPEIIESVVIKYREQYFSIQKIIEWDDYLECMLLEKKDMVIA